MTNSTQVNNEIRCVSALIADTVDGKVKWYSSLAERNADANYQGRCFIRGSDGVYHSTDEAGALTSIDLSNTPTDDVLYYLYMALKVSIKKPPYSTSELIDDGFHIAGVVFKTIVNYHTDKRELHIAENEEIVKEVTHLEELTHSGKIGWVRNDIIFGILYSSMTVYTAFVDVDRDGNTLNKCDRYDMCAKLNGSTALVKNGLPLVGTDSTALEFNNAVHSLFMTIATKS